MVEHIEKLLTDVEEPKLVLGLHACLRLSDPPTMVSSVYAERVSLVSTPQFFPSQVNMK